MKSYTDIEQSKKLAEFLPMESADMYYFTVIHDYPYSQRKIKTIAKIMDGSFSSDYDTPCWSLAALLDIIPYPTLGKHADETWSCASWIEKVNPYFVEGCDSPINACYEMIIKLHELKML